MIHIRPAIAADAAACTALYTHYVLHTIATAQEEPYTEEDFQAFIASDSALPFLVATDADSGKLLGYCRSSLLKNRCGYRHTHEISIYVAHTMTGKGVGKALMTAFIAAAKEAPAIYKLVAIISLPNPESVALHEKFGFIHYGTLPEVIRKLNQPVDAGFWMLDVQ